MRTKFYLLTLFTILLVGCGQKTIKFSVTGDFTGEYTDKFNGKNVSMADGNSLTELGGSTTVIENNSFVIKGEAPKSTIGYISYEGMEDKPYAFVIEKGNIKMQIGDDGIQLSGTKKNEEFQEMSRNIFSHYATLEKLLNSLKRILESGRLTSNGFESIEADYNRVFNNIEKIITNYVIDNVEHPAAEQALTEYSSFLSPNKVIELIDMLPNAETSDKLNKIKAVAENKLKISNGKQYIDIQGTDLKGKETKIANFVGKTKYTLVYFWQSDDDNSQELLPMLRNLNKNKDLTIVGISLDTDKKAWSEVSKFEKISWAQISPNDIAQASKEYSVNTLPFCLLISKDGQIIESRNVNKVMLEGKITSLLSK